MSRPAPEENREQRRTEIVGTALRLLEKEGFDRLSLRGVAQALAMHAAGLYWYIENKQELVDLMAKAIMDEALGDVIAPASSHEWDRWLIDVALRVRRSLLAHRDGARVVASAFVFRAESIAAFLELSLQTLEAEGFTRELAMLGTMTVVRYTMGVTLDEQESPMREAAVRRRILEQALAKGPPVDATRYPRLHDVMSRFYASRVSEMDQGESHFVRGLELVIAGIRRTAGK